MQRKWTLSIFCGLAALLAGGAATALAAGGYGSAEDPLVTLSYITEVAAPEASSRIDSVFSEKQKALKGEIDEKIAALRLEMEQQASQPAFSQQTLDAAAEAAAAKLGGGQSGQWREVSLEKGRQLFGGVGCQLILRRGAAACYSGMINLSSGETLAHGQAVAANNLYLVGTEGCGFVASEACTVLVNGSYTVG